MTGSRIEYTWRSPVLLVWDGEAQEYVKASEPVCMARRKADGLRHRRGDICGLRFWKMIGDIPVCGDHYGEAELWAWGVAADERLAIDAERQRLDSRRERQDRRVRAEAEKLEKSRREAAQRELAAASLVYYVRRESDGLIKIGTTGRVDRRMATLEHDHGPLQLLLTHDGDRAAEERMHARFADWRAEGEWFRPGRPLLEFLDASRRAQGTAPVKGTVRRGIIAELMVGAAKVPPPGRYVRPRQRTRYARR